MLNRYAEIVSIWNEVPSPTLGGIKGGMEVAAWQEIPPLRSG